MPEEHPFDEAIREATRREWEKAKGSRRELSPSLRAAIHAAIRQKHEEKPSGAAARSLEEAKARALFELARRLMSRRFALAAAASVLILALVLIAVMRSKPVELAMRLPPLKGGIPTRAGTLVEASVVVSVNWKKQTIQIPLKAGGELSGQFKSATNAAPLPLVFDVTVAGANAGQPVNGSGQLLIMPQNPADKLDRFSTNALFWIKLDLNLRADGQEESLYRVFGTP